MQRNRPPLARRRLAAAQALGESVAISAIVLFELQYGIARSQRVQQNAEWLRAFLAGGVGVLAFGWDDATIAGNLRQALASLGTPIGPYDLLIAAQAIRHKLTLVTDNTAEFARVPGLTVENWTI